MQTKSIVLLLVILLQKSIVSFSQAPDWVVFNSSNSGLPGNWIGSVEVDSLDNKWIGTIYDGVARFDDVNWTIYTKLNSGLYDHCIQHIFIDSLDQKWFSTCWHGTVSVFDNSGWHIYDSVKTNGAMNQYMTVTDFLYLNDKFYMSTQNFGLVIYDGVSWADSAPWNSNIPGFGIYDMEVDVMGNLWLGQLSVGITKYDGQTWVNYNTQNSILPSNDVTSIAFESTGVMWATTRYDGLVRVDGNNWTVFNTSNSGLPTNILKKIVVDNANVKWLATGNGGTSSGKGLVRYDDVNWTVYDTSNSGLPSNDLTCLKIDKFDNKWIGTLIDGLAVFRQGGVILNVPSSDYPALKGVLIPNPASRNCSLKLPSVVRNCQVEVYSMLSTKVYFEEVSNTAEIVIPVDDLQSGVYFVKLEGENLGGTYKMVVQN